MRKKVFITGATGFVGSYITRLLASKGTYDIIALRRPNSPMQLTADFRDQVEWLEGDVLDYFAMENAIGRVDQVYHCAAMIAYDKKRVPEMMRVNVEGTQNIVDAAMHHNIEKLLFVSSIASVGQTNKSEMINEKSEWEDGKNNSDYAKSKYLAELEVWRAKAEGLSVAIVNPSVIMGSGRDKDGTMRFFHWVKNGLPFYPTGGGGFVDVRDVAKLSVQYMESEIEGERYILNAENVRYKDLLEQIAAAMKTKAPRKKAGKFLTGLTWRFAAIHAFFKGRAPLLTKTSAHQAAQFFQYDNTKSVDAFSYRYIPIDQTIRETGEKLFRQLQPDAVEEVPFLPF